MIGNGLQRSQFTLHRILISYTQWYLIVLLLEFKKTKMQCAANIQNFSKKFAAHCIFTLHIYWIKPSNSLNKGTGNIGCRDQADAWQLYHYPLLAGNSRYPTFNSCKFAFYHLYQVTALVMALFGIHQPDMFIINTRETDEVHHLTVRNCERRILAMLVLPEMIIIIGKERKIGGGCPKT